MQIGLEPLNCAPREGVFRVHAALRQIDNVTRHRFDVSAVDEAERLAGFAEGRRHGRDGLGIECLIAQERNNRHGRAPSLPHRRERDWSLSHRRLAQSRCR